MGGVFGVGRWRGGGEVGLGDAVGVLKKEGDRGPDVCQGGRFLEREGTARCGGRAIYLIMRGILERALASGDGGAGICFVLSASAGIIVVFLGVGVVR